MYRYRVTKYNPAYRDKSGAYSRREWTSYSDIGRVFDDGRLSEDEYSRVESAYLDTAMAFLEEDRVTCLEVVDLEVRSDSPSVPASGASLAGPDLVEACRSILREEFWCRLEHGARFLHFGWDYYMYVGVATECLHAIASAKSRGLFVETFESPYESVEEERA